MPRRRHGVSGFDHGHVAVYIHRMVRTQLFLTEAIHARLRLLAKQQGRTVSDLARDALERVYGVTTADEQVRTLRAIEGLWRGRKDLGSTRGYVRRLRRSTRPGRKKAD